MVGNSKVVLSVIIHVPFNVHFFIILKGDLYYRHM